MRLLTYRLVLLFAFTLPWENVLSFPGAGSVGRLAGLLAGVAWVAAVISSGRVREPRPVHVLALLFVLWNACTLWWTSDGPATQERVFTYIQLLVLTLVIWDTVTTRTRVRQTLFAFLAGCQVTAIALVYNFITATSSSEVHGRVTVGSFHPNDIAMILAFGLPIAGYLMGTPGTDRWRVHRLVAGAAYFPLGGFAVLVTGSRTGVAALVPGVAYLGYMLARRRPGLAVAALGALAALAVLAFPLAPPHVKERLEGTGASISSGDLNERGMVWAEAARIIHDHPVLGIGAGAFREAAVGANKVGHNFILSLLAEVGIVGYALFMAVLITALLPVWRMGPLLKGMWLALFSAWMLAALLHNWEYRKQTWLFIGLVAACGALPDKHRSEEKDHVATERPPSGVGP